MGKEDIAYKCNIGKDKSCDLEAHNRYTVKATAGLNVYVGKLTKHSSLDKTQRVMLS